MKRFLRDFLIVNAVVALGFGIGAWQAGWTASQTAIWLGLACMGAFFIGFAALGGTGPGVAYGNPDPAGVGLGDVVAAGEEAKGAYHRGMNAGRRGDYFEQWKARHGWNSGSHHLAMVVIATGVSTGIATFAIWALG
ncbi:MAG: hypothetical protein ACRDKS_06420 [Actinomycetota bacterium]